ncbi:MAG: MFS transporter [Mycobacteriales bacterium]
MSFPLRPLAAICLGVFMVIMDATIVNVALPALGHDFGAPVADLQWVVDGYTVIFAGLLLLAGGLGDRYGSRRMFRAGLVVFGVTSLACGLAPSLLVLIGARLCQGVGAALLLPSSLALLQASYRDPQVRARAIGAWGAVGGAAAAAGPLCGGLAVASVGWRGVFFVNLPVAAVGWRLVQRGVPETERPESARRGLDWPAQTAGVLALVALTLAVIESGRKGVLGTPLVPAAAVVAVLAGAGFLALERRSAAPMLPLGLFRSRELSAATGVGTLMNFSFYGVLFVMSLYLQHVRGMSPLLTGVALVPQTAMVAAGSWLGGKLTGRYGPRPPMVLGMLLGAAAFAGLALAGAHTPYLYLALPMAASGAGISITMPAATAAVVEAAPTGRTGVASGALNAARQVGSALGIAVLGALLGAGAGFVAGMRVGMLVASAAYLLGAGLAVLCRPSRGDREAEFRKADRGSSRVPERAGVGLAPARDGGQQDG